MTTTQSPPRLRSCAQALLSTALLGIPNPEVLAQQPVANPAAVGAATLVRGTAGTNGIGPGPRAWSARASDLFNGRVFIHGGYDPAIANSLGDLWRFHNGSWVQYPFPGPGPSARSGHAMALDPVQSELVLFGGFQSGLPASRDTWVFQLGTNTWTLAANNGPNPRVDHELLFDLNRGRAYLFGGFDLWQFSPSAELWSWQNNNWTLTQTINPPPARSAHRMVMDMPRDRVWLFGGYDAVGNPLGDTWYLDLNTMTWSQMSSGPTPSPRAWPNLSFDHAQQAVVLHGGLQLGGTDASDVWLLDPSGWRQVGMQGSVPGLDGSVLAYDSGSGSHVLFGGFDGAAGGNSVTGKTWQLAVAGRPGTAVEVAAGCPGGFRGTRLSMPGSLSIAAPVQLQLEHLPGAAGVAFLAIGNDVHGRPGFPLPMPLDAIGLPSCRLRTDLMQMIPMGYVGPSLTYIRVVPNNSGLLGHSVTAQFLAISNLDERAVSNALFGIIGN